MRTNPKHATHAIKSRHHLIHTCAVPWPTTTCHDRLPPMEICRHAENYRTGTGYTEHSFRAYKFIDTRSRQITAACLQQISRYTRQAHSAKHPPPLDGILHFVFGFRHGRVAMQSCCKSIQRGRHICMPAGLSASRPKDLVNRTVCLFQSLLFPLLL